MGAGLLIAAGTGLASIVLGFPFLTSTTVYLDWTPIDLVGLSSAAIFDLGIFLVVLGALLQVLVGLGRIPGAVAASAPSKATMARTAEIA
jgi:multicomponent K+:H+ antiporter subunit A